MRALVLSTLALAALAAAAAAADDLSVAQKDRLFSVDELNLEAGQGVSFTNDDTVAHNLSVKRPNGESKLSVLEKPGEVARVVFDEPGDWRVLCLIHPKMKIGVHVH